MKVFLKQSKKEEAFLYDNTIIISYNIFILVKIS